MAHHFAAQGGMAHHFAAQGGHPECLEVLIKAGCDVMAKDKVGDE